MESGKLDSKELINLCRKMRLHALDMALAAGRRGAHLSGSLSCIEIYAVLYGSILKYNVSNPRWEGRDRFIAGKEHARLAEFPVMAEMGFFPIEELNSYEEDNGLLVGHQRNLDLGLEYASLSLGMELSFAVGKSIYAKQNNLPYHVYVLLGDAECNEGSIWEAVLTAGHYKLDNLTVIVDRNYMAVDGNTEDWMAQMDMELKFKSFGWESKTVNGHSVEQLIDSLQYRPIDKPYALIAETVKGKGVSFMENNKLWHQAVLSVEQYNTAYAEILNS